MEEGRARADPVREIPCQKNPAPERMVQETRVPEALAPTNSGQGMIARGTPPRETPRPETPRPGTDSMQIRRTRTPAICAARRSHPETGERLGELLAPGGHLTAVAQKQNGGQRPLRQTPAGKT